MPNRFELKQLREEAEKYQYHNAGNHGVWPRLVWEPRSKSPAERLDDAVESPNKSRIGFREIPGFTYKRRDSPYF